MTQLLTSQQVAQQLGITTRWLRALPIKRVLVGRLIRYRAVDVERYIQKIAGDRKRGAA